MAELIKKVIWAAQTADQREGFTVYDIIGAFCVCVIIVALFLIGGSLEYHLSM